MTGFLHHFVLASPLFLLILLGYLLARSGHWPVSVSEALSRFAYELGVEPPAWVAWRALIGLTTLALFIAWRARSGVARPRRGSQGARGP